MNNLLTNNNHLKWNRYLFVEYRAKKVRNEKYENWKIEKNAIINKMCTKFIE